MMLNDIENLFHQVIELPAEQRPKFLSQNCGEDAVLQRRVLDLAAMHEQNLEGGFVLDQPLIEHPETIEQPTTEQAELSVQPGDTIGRYRLLEKIGEGGMGAVYMAEQVEDVHRKVALKIIKLGMDTRQVIARFEAERQALAMFDHENIARILDAGSTVTGRPFFVMELVRGSSIMEFSKANRLSIETRLQIFIQVCRAVQHAHQKGIIHRDLKPSNILMTLFDGVPVPKVIDFGISKALNNRLTEKTLFTRYAAMIGTPQYMSPEQAEMSGLDVDTRSDIYSLGVILYELLTGTTPISVQQLKGLGPAELVETLKQYQIETPSSRMSKAISIPDEQCDFQSDWQRRLRGDLDQIILKAMSRDRTLRYGSANELAADVERYLAGEPVEATPPSSFYRLQKTWSRHWKAIVPATAVMLTLLIATVVTSVSLVNLSRTKQDLGVALGELKTKNRELQNKEAKIRESALAQSYETAIGIAFFKFREKFFLEHAMPMTVSPQEAGLSEEMASQFFPVDVETEVVAEFGSGTMVMFDSFLVNDRELIAVKHAELVKESLRPIQLYIDKEARQEKLRMEASELIAEAPMPSMPKELKQIIRDRTIEMRPDFFRELVVQYRSIFGEQHPRVAHALNLLAVVLLETKDGKAEAESCVREAMAINQEELTNRASREILKLIQLSQ